MLMVSSRLDVTTRAKCLHCVRTACALRAHCVRTPCILHTQRLRYSPKNTCHLFRLKGVNTIGLARCPSIFLVVVITNSIFEEELSGPGVDSPPSSIGDREPSSDDDHVDFFAVVDMAIPINDLEHLGSRITLKSTKVLVHILCVRKSTLQGESNCREEYSARRIKLPLRIPRSLHCRQ